MATEPTTTEVLAVSELFYSLQGESTWAGLPCLFVRLAGCNLRCRYCDARYTWDEPGRPMTQGEIVDWVRQTPGVMVEITGGEPLQQQAVYGLMRQLQADARTVLLETNGSLPLCAVPDAVHIIMDIKCPDSGTETHYLADNIEVLRERQRRGCRDEVKFVLSSVSDFHFAHDMVVRHQLDTLLPVLFSPVRQSLDATQLAQLLLDHRLKVRLQLQLHSLLWPGQDRGV